MRLDDANSEYMQKGITETQRIAGLPLLPCSPLPSTSLKRLAEFARNGMLQRWRTIASSFRNT